VCIDESVARELSRFALSEGDVLVSLDRPIISTGLKYAGRVCVALGGCGCLDCLGLLDRRQVRRYFQSDEQRDQEDAIYGINKDALTQKGPSVSPLNGVVASLAAMEFMVAVTGLRAPTRLQTYRGWTSKVVVSSDEPRARCVQCKGTWGSREAADVERYLRSQVLTPL